MTRKDMNRLVYAPSVLGRDVEMEEMIERLQEKVQGA